MVTNSCGVSEFDYYAELKKMYGDKWKTVRVQRSGLIICTKKKDTEVSDRLTK